nr:glycosyltransferase N-terminal domain-containing protein [Limnobacter humi]
MRGLYTLLLALVQPLLALYLLKRAARQPEYRAAWSQRFLAAVPKCDMLTNGQRRLWVHAVSVGEAHAISPLVKHWAKVYPADVWVISCTTPTGLATCKSLYSHLNGVVFCYLPYDLPWLMSRCMARLKATSLWLVETELWPNLLAVARRRGLPVALLNARISPTTGKRLRQLSLLSKPAIQALHTVVCQTAADAAVFESLGRPVDAICGNLKFDVDLRPELAALGRQWRQVGQGNPVLLFASSREGEEPLLLEALLRTQFFKRMPQAAVWIVPRHPQRTDEVFELMVQAATRLGVARPVRRSQWGTQADATLVPKGTEGRGQVRLVLGDSMGEMPAYYSLADLALLGGSWLELGGQNLIEACAYGCPVWMGPHTFNFKKAAEDALAAGAARRFESLQAACEAFMDKQFDLEAMKKSAFSYARSHRGATLTTFNALNARLI